MSWKSLFWLLGCLALFLLVGFRSAETATDRSPAYTQDGQLKFPERYREWVYLTSGFDMSYNPTTAAAAHHVFDNVFVNPDAYASFLKTGAWPDKTVFVLEVRGAKSKGSINQAGNYQDTDLMGVEAHVKDTGRFAGKWAFFGFDAGKIGKIFPQSADCYQCHEAHAAVDTTFVQFYPTLLPVAKSKGTLDRAYLNELAGTKK